MFEDMIIHFALTMIRNFIKSPQHALQYKNVLLDIGTAIDELYPEGQINDKP